MLHLLSPVDFFTSLQIANSGRKVTRVSTIWNSLQNYDRVQSGVDLVQGVVKEVQPKKLVLTDGTELPYGLLVWSTGVGASAFVKSLSFPKSPGGRCPSWPS